MKYINNLGEKMDNFLNKYGKVALIVVLSLILGVDQAVEVAKGFASDEVSVLEAGEVALAEALRPVITEVVKAEIREMKEDIQGVSEDIGELKEYNVKQITNNAIAAYTKVFTIEDLEASPLKKVSITDGLMLDSCYDILYAIDMERTKVFYDYLIRDAP